MTINEIENKINLVEKNEELEIILETLFLYNCRISEILSLEKSQIPRSNFVVLKGKKNSQNIIIRDRSIVQKIFKLSEKRKDKVFIYTNYKYVYRFILKFFPELIRSRSKDKNRKVTHVFRYINAENFDNEETLKALLHHNSKKSQKYYKKK